MPNNEYLDITKKIKKSIDDLENLRTVESKIDAVKQIVKFEITDIVQDFPGLGTTQFYIHDKFLIAFFWLGSNTNEIIKRQFRSIKTKVSAFEKKISESNLPVSPKLAIVIRTKSEFPNIKATLGRSMEMYTRLKYLEKEIDLKYIVCFSRFGHKVFPEQFEKYVKSLGFPTAVGSIEEYFEQMKEYLLTNE